MKPGNYLSSQQQFVRAATFAPLRGSIGILISPVNQFVISNKLFYLAGQFRISQNSNPVYTFRLAVSKLD